MDKKTTAQKVYMIISATAVLAVAAVIFYLSAQTAKESSGTSGGLIEWLFTVTGINFPQSVVRTAAHFAEYAGFGFLVCNFVFSASRRNRFIISATAAFAYAVTDEIHQIFVPGRAFQITDLAVDLSGILIGTVVFSVLILIINKGKNKNKTPTAEPAQN